MGIKYHLGCGTKYLDGYINVDFPQSQHSVITVRADIYSNLLEMKYDCCEEIRSHHVFEHFNYIESLALLIKWSEALQQSGQLRIDVPDFETLCRQYLINRDIKKSFKLIRLLFGSHEAEWAYHINGWSSDTLEYVLEKFGFEMISCHKYGNPLADFPNCGIDMKFMKKEDQKNLQAIAKDLLWLYTESSEHALYNFYCKELERLC